MDVDEISIPLQVVLGTATLSFEALSQLAPGDVVILDQSIRTPLSIKNNSSLIGKGFPGGVGSFKGIKIESLTHG